MMLRFRRIALFLLGAVINAFATADIPQETLKQCDENKNAKACLDVSITYLVYKDKKKAAEYREKACYADASECSDLGGAFEKGVNGYEQNLAKAVEIYARYCDYRCNNYKDRDWDDNGAEACKNAARLFYEGEGGVKKDNKKALYYYEKGCKMDRYGPICYMRDTIVLLIANNKEYVDMGFLNKLCSEQQRVDYCIDSADLYWKDIIDYPFYIEKVAKDPSRALMYYEKSCMLGSVYGCNYANDIKKLLSHDLNSSK